MSFPYELLQYAENFYRRFPDEFLALGAPGLEEMYDLRPNSTLSRCVQDTPTEKSVEITIRRWQTPSMSMGGGLPPHAGGTPHGLGYAQAHAFAPPQHLAAIGVMQQQAAGLSASSTAAGHYGHPMYSGYPGMPPASPAAAAQSAAPPPRWEAELTSRLSRLEGALSSLKPQIEVVLQQQQQQPAQSPVHYDLPQSQPAICSATANVAASQFAGSSDDAAVNTQPLVALSSQPAGTKTSLADRRALGGLAIATAPKAQAAPKVVEPQIAVQAQQNAAKPRPTHVAVMQEATTATSPQNENKVDSRRPSVNINTTRVAPGFADPQSPRSPGRYSAWK